MRQLALPLIASLALSWAGCGGSSGNRPDSGIDASAGTMDSGIDGSAQPACVRDRAAPDGIAIDTSDPRLVIISGLPSTKLGNTRKIRVFLPESYATSGQRAYPVLYMHDGQNLFDAATASFGHEWQVDETVDRLVAEDRIPEVMVVGIDSTADRINEYTPTEDPDFTGPGGEKGGKGPLYEAFVVEELKPYIDSHYRTLCGPDATGIIGSSLGGLISFDMGWRYPEVFGLVGVVSPSFWWNDSDTLARLQQTSQSAAPESKFWLDSGTFEEEDDRDEDGLIDVVDDVRDVRDRLMALGHTFGTTLGGMEAIGGFHNEQSWAARFDEVLLYLLGKDTQPALSAVALTLSKDRLALEGPAPQQVAHAHVLATYESGLAMTVPNPLASFVVASTEIATIDAAGAIHPVAAGTTTVSATYGQVTSPATSFEVIDAFPTIARITFDVTVPADTPAGKTVTLAGTLNNWQPDLSSFALQQVDATHWTGTFEFPYQTSMQFKLTLQPQTGDAWYMVEKGASCEELGNRFEVADSDKTHQATVQNWRNVAPCGN